MFKIKNYEGGIVGEKNVAIFGDIYGKTLEIDLDGISAWILRNQSDYIQKMVE